MAIDLCLEGAGWLLMMVDTNASGMAGMFRRSSAEGSSSVADQAAPTTTRVAPAATNDRRMQVRAAAAGLPIAQAEVVFLVDVCGYDYDRAAAALRIDRTEVADRITAGRTSIRQRLSAADPVARSTS